MIGPGIVPVLNTAMARPWRSGGLICNSVACDNGASPAPATPCNARKRTSSPRLVAAPHSAEAGGKPMTETRKMYLMPNRPASQPVSGHHDRGADDIRGQCPGSLVLRGRQAALDVRQGDIKDRVVYSLHDVRHHDRERDHAAVGDRHERGDRLSPHSRRSLDSIITAGRPSHARGFLSLPGTVGLF